MKYNFVAFNGVLSLPEMETTSPNIFRHLIQFFQMLFIISGNNISKTMVIAAGNIDKENMDEKELSMEASFKIGKVNLILGNNGKSMLFKEMIVESFLKMPYLYIRTDCLVDVVEENKLFLKKVTRF